ncbi:DUF1294 domain-containing protein [Bacillus sp. 03113]|uniref:DUF1294 domain-containing protein n=1 Tax=Bacillus sp. 03113 TaxID=2578211 RepID=UPI00215C5D75|nr:DUF1294 domain-containing protein [Bacillus sp. 03113]
MLNAIFLLVLIVINIIGFYIMMVDKNRARRKQYRIREKHLWIIAFCFGAIGMTVGMNVFRHKTKHAQFKFGLPLLGMIESTAICYVLLM